jgi:hypothetical protein
MRHLLVGKLSRSPVEPKARTGVRNRPESARIVVRSESPWGGSKWLLSQPALAEWDATMREGAEGLDDPGGEDIEEFRRRLAKRTRRTPRAVLDALSLSWHGVEQKRSRQELISELIEGWTGRASRVTRIADSADFEIDSTDECQVPTACHCRTCGATWRRPDEDAWALSLPRFARAHKWREHRPMPPNRLRRWTSSDSPPQHGPLPEREDVLRHLIDEHAWPEASHFDDDTAEELRALHLAMHNHSGNEETDQP